MFWRPLRHAGIVRAPRRAFQALLSGVKSSRIFDMHGARQTARGSPVIEPVEELVDHVRGPATAALIVEYGDYECP
jgi:hypothetical protein